jgi:hypothetical protein
MFHAYRVYWIGRRPALRSWSAWPGFAMTPNAVPLRSKWTGSVSVGLSSVTTTVTELPEQAPLPVHFTCAANVKYLQRRR